MQKNEAKVISSVLHIRASEELNEEVEEELKKEDPPKQRIVELAGTAKLLKDFLV